MRPDILAAKVQSAEVQEASFGIAHFDYDPVRDLRVVAGGQV